MKPVDTTQSSQTETIAFAFDLRHSRAKVWRALTDPALLSEWLLPAMELPLVVRALAGASWANDCTTCSRGHHECTPLAGDITITGMRP